MFDNGLCSGTWVVSNYATISPYHTIKPSLGFYEQFTSFGQHLHSREFRLLLMFGQRIDDHLWNYCTIAPRTESITDNQNGGLIVSTSISEEHIETSGIGRPYQKVRMYVFEHYSPFHSLLLWSSYCSPDMSSARADLEKFSVDVTARRLEIIPMSHSRWGKPAPALPGNL